MANSDPTLTVPPSEKVAPDSATPISGISYQDSFAQTNPGQLWLGITDSGGILSATDGEGAAPGSGSSAIVLSASYADVQDILNSLTYTAPSASGSDTISFDIWDQAGTEITGSIPVTISSGGGGTIETWTGGVSTDWNTAANWSGNAVPAVGDSVIIPYGSPNNATLSNTVLTGETITLAGTATGARLATVMFNDVTLDSLLQSSAGSDSDGKVVIGGTLTIGTAGTIAPEASSTLSLFGTAEAIVNNGLVEETAGGHLDIYNGPSTASTPATFTNNGSIVADGGTVALSNTASLPGTPPVWMLVNHGSIVVENGGDLSLTGTFVGGTVAFNGAGVLGLQQAMAFTDGAAVSGFGQGDSINLNSGTLVGTLAFANGTLSVGKSDGTVTEAIPLVGTYGLGNFELGGGGSTNSPTYRIAYAADGQPSGIINPDIAAPASAAVAQGATLSLGDVSVSANPNFTSVSLGIVANSGTLYMDGASGSGTNTLTLSATSFAQANTDLASLSYVPAQGATSDTVEVRAASGFVSTDRWIPVAIGNGSSGPTLNEPASDTVGAGATVAVGGSYSDGFAAGNPGQLFLGISDSSGTLSAIDASGNSVAGSGSNSIALSTDYVDLNAILASLHYTAGGTAGSDTISFDVWNQAGVETTASTAVTIDPAAFSAASMSAAFLAPGSVTPAMPAADTGGGPLASLPTDTVSPFVAVPLNG